MNVEDSEQLPLFMDTRCDASVNPIPVAPPIVTCVEPVVGMFEATAPVRVTTGRSYVIALENVEADDLPSSMSAGATNDTAMSRRKLIPDAHFRTTQLSATHRADSPVEPPSPALKVRSNTPVSEPITLRLAPPVLAIFLTIEELTLLPSKVKIDASVPTCVLMVTEAPLCLLFREVIEDNLQHIDDSEIQDEDSHELPPNRDLAVRTISVAHFPKIVRLAAPVAG